MSHRVTTRTEIKDKDLAKAALQQAGYSFSEYGNTLTITSGDLRNASLNLDTGDITGDTDYRHSESKFGALKQYYSEQKYKKELSRNGGYIESRAVDKNGDIILMCAVS
jgi:hypothetical protein